MSPVLPSNPSFRPRGDLHLRYCASVCRRSWELAPQPKLPWPWHCVYSHVSCMLVLRIVIVTRPGGGQQQSWQMVCPDTGGGGVSIRGGFATIPPPQLDIGSQSNPHATAMSRWLPVLPGLSLYCRSPTVSPQYNCRSKPAAYPWTISPSSYRYQPQPQPETQAHLDTLGSAQARRCRCCGTAAAVARPRIQGILSKRPRAFCPPSANSCDINFNKQRAKHRIARPKYRSSVARHAAPERCPLTDR
ncbi:hypothetical protein QBC34DRAFT_462572 [Podospora aff. communis PSN243]|uniref:Uncharacterized protein n=1 Tax=Podospora aff. communis PSN243 TaxID=3040156 RepID=A0AAV9GNX6_9PEZI|nr:hypothetical protein QBC34DRAFT_462572 [Podospora aff. communis PSN243]